MLATFSSWRVLRFRSNGMFSFNASVGLLPAFCSSFLLNPLPSLCFAGRLITLALAVIMVLCFSFVELFAWSEFFCSFSSVS